MVLLRMWEWTYQQEIRWLKIILINLLQKLTLESIKTFRDAAFATGDYSSALHLLNDMEASSRQGAKNLNIFRAVAQQILTLDYKLDYLGSMLAKQ